MKLHYIELTNFRQFRGQQRFNLTSDGEQPVSLLFGANGSGKTTLLNAFTWALYGSMSDDVEVQERMITDIVWRQTSTGAIAQVSVELGFDDADDTYRLVRRAEVVKESDEQPKILAPDLGLWTITSDGRSIEVKAPQEKISSILPEGISRFFFFNGERIEKLVQKGAYSEIQQDIKALLNIKHVERALEHLPKAARKLSAAVKDRGGEVAAELQREIDKIEDDQTELSSNLKIAESDISTFRAEQEHVLESLRKHQSVAPIQKQRDEAEKDLERARADLESARAKHAYTIGTRGFLAFTDDLVRKTSSLASSLYEKGALPAPLKREFVDRLLETDECICGAPLHAGSSARDHVQEWRQRAGLQAVETAWQQLNGKLPEMSSARDNLRSDMEDSSKRISDAQETVDRLEILVSELSGQLKDTDLKDVQQLESNRIDLDKRLLASVRLSEKYRNKIEELNKEREQKQYQLAQAELKDEYASKARDRADMVRNVETALKEILAIRSAQMRSRLQEELQSIFSSITVKPYTPRLNEDFELALYQDVDGVEMQVPKSTGENQILSVSFVAAVSKLARQIPGETRAEGKVAGDEGIYPIVMDAAFGSLDQNYQKEVSRALAKMAPQLVVLVSKSQGLGDVIKELRPHVKHLGVIVTHTMSERDVSEPIEIDGANHPYICAGSDSNYSELKEITA